MVLPTNSHSASPVTTSAPICQVSSKTSTAAALAPGNDNTHSTSEAASIISAEMATLLATSLHLEIPADQVAQLSLVME